MKLPFTVESFKEMLDEVLKPDDIKLLRIYFLKYDNNNLFNYLKNKDTSFNNIGHISRDEVKEIVDKVKEDIPVKNKKIPAFYEEYIKRWLTEESQTDRKFWEDLISSLYMDYGLNVKNSLMSKWFELNLNIGNLLSAIYARKYSMDVSKVVVGNNDIARIIRENANMRDFGLSLELDYFDSILRISEESDIYERERKLDKFRWDWLEENTVFDYFNIEYIFAYLCKLQILERWVSLNAEEGEKVFRDLINDLKNEAQIPEDN